MPGCIVGALLRAGVSPEDLAAWASGAPPTQDGRLTDEVRALRTHHADVQVVSPDAATLKAMGWNMLDRSSTTAVMRAAFLATADQLHTATTSTIRSATRTTTSS